MDNNEKEEIISEQREVTFKDIIKEKASRENNDSSQQVNIRFHCKLIIAIV